MKVPNLEKEHASGLFRGAGIKVYMINLRNKSNYGRFILKNA
jgi:hypothetical protein